MKNFRKFIPFFSILLIFSIIVWGISLPVLADKRGDVDFEKNRRETLSDTDKDFYKTKEPSTGEITDKSFRSIELDSKKIEKEKRNYVEGEILVKYKKNKINLETFLGRATAESFNRAKSMEKKEDLERNNVSILKIKDNKTVEEKIAELKSDPNIEYIEPNYIYPWTSIPNDSNFPELWGLHNTGQTVNEVFGTPNADINVPEAWDIFTGSSSTVIAILDSGIAYNHPDLVDNMWDGSIDCKDENNQSISCPYHGWDYVNNDFDPVDDDGHGTHVAGSIGAKGNNNRGVVGVNWDIKLMALKVGDYQGAISGDVVKAIEFAINNGVKIINASFGGEDDSQTMYDAINVFKDAGGLFITAAGNSEPGNNNDAGIHNYPCDHDLDNIICVAATDSNDNLAEFSNYGPISVDVGAPGVNIYSTVPGLIPSLVLSETFEGIDNFNIPSGWTKTDYWGVFNTGVEHWDEVLYGDVSHIPYEPLINSTITLPTYNLSNATGATIDFWTICDTEYYGTDYDYMALEISSNGSSFTEEFRFNELVLDVLNNESPLDSSGMAVYHFQQIPISADYLTNNFKLRFRWSTDSYNDPDIDYYGCLIDDLTINKYTYTDGSDEQYEYYDGTSMAVPHVAGLAGLIWGYKPGLTYSQVKDIILSTGDDKSSLSGKTVMGKRINAYNALESLIDTTAPAIILLGENPVNLYIGDSYTDAGATALDDVDGDITADIVVGGDTVDTSTVGIYIITYNVSDAAGNPAEEVTRTVNVSKVLPPLDTTAPVIDSFIIPETSDSLTVPVTSFVAHDNVSVTGYMLTETSDIPSASDSSWSVTAPTNYIFSTEGVKTLYAWAKDAAGNISSSLNASVTITLPVPPDTTAPTLSEVIPVPNPTNNNTPEYTFNSDEAGIINYGGECTSDTIDAIAGDNPIIFNELVDGTYDSCTIVVTDEAGNPSVPLNVSTFTIDTTAPVITLLGEDPITIEVGTEYNDAGAIASDGVDGGDISDSIVKGGDVVDKNTLGTYVITYNVSDAAGNPAAEVTRTVNVADTTPPVIILLGDNPVDLTVGDAYDDAGAMANDNYDGDITDSIIVVDPVDPNIIGIYTVTYNVTDSSGNPAEEITRIVNVNPAPDTTPPVLTEVTPVSTPTNNTTPSYTFNTNEAGTISYSGACSSGTIDTTEGDNTIVFNELADGTYNDCGIIVTDASDNASDALIISEFTIDTIAPTIILLGESPIDIEIGVVYSDAGTTGTDNVDGDISDSIVTGGDTVDSNTLGTYTITYNITDNAGNEATEIIRTVNIVDTTVPVIVLLGSDPVTIEVGTTYNDAGATANDNYDGNITANLIIVNPVDSNTVGTYTVTYNVTDSLGNEAVQVARTVNVVDTTAPIITLLGENPVTIPVNTAYEDAGAIASDNYDGDISANIVTVNPVDINNVGTYYVTYNVTDAAGNQATEATRTVNVVDVSTPVITLLGDNPVSLEVGAEYSDAGATATDDVDGDITDDIVVVNNVNTSVLGSYTVAYNVTDSAGNPAPEVARTVNVVDTTVPVITLLGDNPASVEAGYEYNDAGAIANDNYDGDISDNIVIISNVDYNTVGTYTVTYNVTDSSDNPAEEVIRTVNVSEAPDITAPAIILLGENPVNLYIGDSYTDAGATALDDVDGDITADIVVGGDTVDTSTVGIYIITYNVSDAAGNPAEEVTRTVNVSKATAPTAYLTGPVAGDRTELVITFNEALHTDTLAISDIAFLLDSALNDAFGSSTPISVVSATSTVNWDNSTIDAPIATISIPSTTFIEGQIVRLNFRENAVKDLVGNTILSTTNVDVTVLASTQIAAALTVTINTTQTEVVITSPHATSITVPVTVTNATININSLTTDDGATTTAILSETTLNVITDISTSPIEVVIPANTVITAPTGWSGVINVPRVEPNSSVTVAPDSGNTATVSSVIEVGYGDTELIFNKAVRLLIPGAAGRYVGYSRSGIFTKITTICSADTQAAGDAFAAAGDCKIDVDSDLAIWTKHFTKFIIYTQTVIPSSGGGGGGGGGGSYTPPPASMKGDINKDKKVDKYDFSMMMAAWGKTGTNSSDLNGDNKIDKYDFAFLMSNWSTL